MKTIQLISLCIISFGTTVFAQTNDKLICPKISVINPLERVNHGETMTFTVNITEVDLQEHKIVWSIDKGKIIQGQGTPVIIVDTEGLSQEVVIAGVKLKGVRGGCRNSAKGFGTVSRRIGNYDPDEFGELLEEDIKTRIDFVAVELENRKTSTAYVVNYGSLEDIEYRKNLILNHLRFRGVEDFRVVFVDGGKENSIRTRIFFMSCEYKIKGPDTGTNRDEPMIFSLDMGELPSSYDSKYKWTVNNGTIIQGQGTDMIVVNVDDLYDEVVEATLEIEGLPESCQSKFSENGVVYGEIIGHPFDEFGIKKNNDVRYRLDLFFIELINNLDATGFIVNYGSAEDVRKREKIIREQAKLREFDMSRILFIYKGEEKEIRTRLWIVPEGADVSQIN